MKKICNTARIVLQKASITLVRQYACGCCGTQLLLLIQRTGCGNKMADRGYSEAVSIETVIVFMLLAKREARNMPYGMSVTYVYVLTGFTFSTKAW